MTAPEPFPFRQRTFSAEIFTINEYGDPGFRHARGDFYTRDAAAMYAITQASILCAVRELPRVAVEISHDRSTTPEVFFTGTPTELITNLSGIREFAAAARRAQLPAPPEVLDVIGAATTSTSSALDDPTTHFDVREVEVLSTRPYPLPNSRTFAGTFDAADAARIADTVAEQLQGTVAAGRDEMTVVVTHETQLSPDDLAAIALHVDTQRLLANMSVLDPIVDAVHIGQIQADLDALPPSPATVIIGDLAEVKTVKERPRPPAAASAGPAIGAVTTSTRPRGLVSPPAARTAGTTRVESASARSAALTAAHVVAPSARVTDHGLG